MSNLVKIGPTAAEIWRFFDFSKFQIFNGGDGQKGPTTSPCQISLKSAQTRPRYRDFSIFQNGGRHHLGFSKFQIFKGGTVKRVELRHHAKFRQNRSKRGRDM